MKDLRVVLNAECPNNFCSTVRSSRSNLMGQNSLLSSVFFFNHVKLQNMMLKILPSIRYNFRTFFQNCIESRLLIFEWKLDIYILPLKQSKIPILYFSSSFFFLLFFCITTKDVILMISLMVTYKKIHI